MRSLPERTINLDEINNLISIRTYIGNTLNNPTVSKEKVRELNGILLLLDRMIVENILDPKFKAYVKYNEVENAIKEAREITNIKSGMLK